MRDGRHRRTGYVELLDAPQLLRFRRHRQAAFGLHVGDHQHVRAVAIALEPVGHVLAQHRRRERPERLAELDLQVHLGLHLGRARVADDGPTAQGPRAEFHAALHQADDLLGRESRCHFVGEHRAIDPSRHPAALGDGVSNLRLAELRPEIGTGHSIRILWAWGPGDLGAWALGRMGGTLPGAGSLRADARLAEMTMPEAECDAEGATGITGRGLTPHVLERPFTQDAAVADTIKRHTTSQAQITHPGFLVRERGHLEHHLFGDLLDRARQVHLALRQPALRLAGRAAEQLLHPRPGHGQSVGVGEELLVHPQTAIVLDVDDVVLDRLHVLGLAVGRQAHDLVLTGVDAEAGEVGERGIQQAE